MMLWLLVLVFVVSSSNVSSHRVKGSVEFADYLAYKAEWNKSYTLEEDDIHHSAYLANIQQINKHNQLYDQGKSTYYQGVNHFTDMTKAEFTSRLSELSLTKHEPGARTHGTTATSPEHIDWRDEGAVGGVRDQGAMGGPGSLVAADCLHAEWFIKTAEDNCVSIDQLQDCTHGDFNRLPSEFLQYVQSQGVHGVDTCESYGPGTGTCKTNVTTDDAGIAATCNAVVSVAAAEADLQDAVGNVGPVAVLVNASPWMTYTSGIFDDPNCSTQVNHAVSCIGYDTKQNYWILRNSWGSSWGEAGYIRVIKGKNMCGILEMAVYPAV